MACRKFRNAEAGPGADGKATFAVNPTLGNVGTFLARLKRHEAARLPGSMLPNSGSRPRWRARLNASNAATSYGAVLRAIMRTAMPSSDGKW